MVAIVIKVPIIHVVLLPLALLSVLAKRCKRRSGKRPQTCDVTDVNPSRKPRNSRKYDLVLVGATGFTGTSCSSNYSTARPQIRVTGSAAPPTPNAGAAHTNNTRTARKQHACSTQTTRVQHPNCRHIGSQAGRPGRPSPEFCSARL